MFPSKEVRDRAARRAVQESALRTMLSMKSAASGFERVGQAARDAGFGLAEVARKLELYESSEPRA
jgi:hypothetical protein